MADPQTLSNLRIESGFSAFHGVYMALALMAAPVMAVEGPAAGPYALTVLMNAFPLGVLLGPLWARLGGRIGMRRLVILCGVVGNAAMIGVAFTRGPWAFTVLVSLAQLMLAGMRMGQSSLYPAMYDRSIRGRVLGRLTSWTFATMVPAILLAGWMLTWDSQSFRLAYPLAGVCGLIACHFYGRLILPEEPTTDPTGRSAGFRGVFHVLITDRAYRLYQIAFFTAGSAFFMSAHVVVLLIKGGFALSPLGMSVWTAVVPQLALAVSSPLWGTVIDRIGFARCRMLISGALTVYLLCYWIGVASGSLMLVYVGCVLFGITNGGGQVTWVMGPGHYAPQGREVPAYSGVHFVLNGLRGLIAPWLGSLLFLMIGPASLLAAAACAALSFPFLWRLRAMEIEGAKPASPSGQSGEAPRV